MKSMGTVRLRGNTFLALLLKAANVKLGVRTASYEKENEITRANMLRDLIKMSDPAYNPGDEGTLENYFSKYLLGTAPKNSAVLPFRNPRVTFGLHMRLELDYDKVLAEMDQFCRKYLQMEGFSPWLLAADLVESILQDETFDGEFDTGRVLIGKQDLDQQRHFILQPFLLSVWDTILQHYADPGEGVQTYKEWAGITDDQKSDNRPKPIITLIGIKRAKTITVETDIPTGLRRPNAGETNSKETAAKPERMTVTQTGEINAVGTGIEIRKTVIYNQAGTSFYDDVPEKHFDLSTEYYHLIVWGDSAYFGAKHVIIRKDRCLIDLDALDGEQGAFLHELSEEAKKILMQYPCLLAYRNRDYGEASEAHRAWIGRITAIKNTRDGIDISFEIDDSSAIPQTKLIEHRDELGIRGGENFTELDDSHWTIKKCDLFSVIRRIMETEQPKGWWQR